MSPEIVLAGLVLGVLDDLLHQRLGREDVDPHGHQGEIRVVGQSRRVLGLFQKILHFPGLVYLEDAEGAALRPGHHDRGHGEIRPPAQVIVQHRPVIHLVDVVAGQDQHLLRALGLQEVEVLEDGVGGAPVPAAHHDLLGRHAVDEFPQVRVHDVPGLPEVLVQRKAAVLGEDVDAANPGIDAVGQGEVDDPVQAPEGDGRLGLVPGEGKETLAFAPGHDDGGEFFQLVHHLEVSSLTFSLSSVRSEDFTT